jgi:hypothetical protein
MSAVRSLIMSPRPIVGSRRSCTKAPVVHQSGLAIRGESARSDHQVVARLGAAHVIVAEVNEAASSKIEDAQRDPLELLPGGFGALRRAKHRMPLLKPRQQVVVQVVHDRSPSAFPESTSHRCIEAVRASTPTGKPRQAWSRGNFRHTDSILAAPQVSGR